MKYYSITPYQIEQCYNNQYQPPLMLNEPLCESRPFCLHRQNGQSLDEYKQNKILPHISEQYEYRITNRLLIEKIVNPRRDKIIIDSLTHTSCSHFYRKKKPNPNNASSINYRRKIVQTALSKKRGSPSDHRGPVLLENELRSENLRQRKNSEKDLSHAPFISKNQLVESRAHPKEQLSAPGNAETQEGYVRDHLVGKIVRNNSNYIRPPSQMARNPSKHCYTSTFHHPTLNGHSIEQYPPSGKPQEKIKRLVKRIYQSRAFNNQKSFSKQNLEEIRYED